MSPMPQIKLDCVPSKDPSHAYEYRAIPRPHQQMKMILQQAKRKRLRHRFDVLEVELQEVAIVALFDEDILAVGAAIEDVIVHAGFERGWTGHW